MIFVQPVVGQKSIIDEITFKSLSPKNIEINEADYKKELVVNFRNLKESISTYDEKANNCDNKNIRSLKNLITSSPRGILDEVYFLLAINHEICNDLKKAEEYYKKALSLRRRNSLAIYRLATIDIRNKNFMNVHSLIQEAKWEGFKNKSELSFLSGIVDLNKNNHEAALKNFEDSISKNPNHFPSVFAAYETRLLLRNTLKDPTKIAILDSQIANDIAAINRLDPENMQIAITYIKQLLNSGDPINSPGKLNEGLKITNFWLEKKTPNLMDFALIKIQFLEKQIKPIAALEFLNELESRQTLSAPLKAKKAALETVPSDES